MSTQTLNPALALVENLHSSIKGCSPSQELKSENDGNATTNSASLAEKLSDKIICHAWQRMISIYGHKWSSHLGFADDGTGLLTDAAKTWQKGLSGVTLEQLKYGFDMLIFKNHDWPPSLPEFRKLCLSNVPSGIPSADEVLQVLVAVQGRTGTLASRYQHPLIFAISQSINLFELRRARSLDAMRMIKSAYEKLILSGWQDWPAHAHIEQKAIEKDRNKSVGVSAFKLIRGDL